MLLSAGDTHGAKETLTFWRGAVEGQQDLLLNSELSSWLDCLEGSPRDPHCATTQGLGCKPFLAF